MKKTLTLLALIILLTSFTTACKKDTPIILFNHLPINKDTILNNSREFLIGDRIYYIFITEKPIQGDMIRVQLLKKEDKTYLGGYKIVYANDYRVMQDQVYYYNDYFVINEKGCYVLQIFSMDKLDEPMSRDYFYVK